MQWFSIEGPQVTAEGVVWGCLVSDKDGNNAFHQAQHSSTYILIYKYVIVFNKYKLDRNHKLHWSSIAFVLNLFFIDNLTLHILCRNRFSISTCIQSPMFYEHVLRLWQWKFDFLVKFSPPAMCLFASFSDPSQPYTPPSACQSVHVSCNQVWRLVPCHKILKQLEYSVPRTPISHLTSSI
jgi:hypothetical protein